MLFCLIHQVVRFPRLAVFSFPKLLSTKTRIMPKLASNFGQKDVELLKVNFHPASFEDVIPILKDPGIYVFCLFLTKFTLTIHI